jgi:uncharacterized SAM-binding protein YcdF (DUF218 family)
VDHRGRQSSQGAEAKRTARLKRRFFRCALLVIVTLGGLTAVGLHFAEPLLCVRHEPQSADAVVLLGGDPRTRPQRAAELVTNGYASVVIVTGTGDCQQNFQRLLDYGVSTNHVAVTVECESRSTQENALFTVRLLREHKCRRVLLVTSWFHSRRSLACFRKYSPDVEFVSVPATREFTGWQERNRVLAEYLKTAVYAVQFGIWPAAE